MKRMLLLSLVIICMFNSSFVDGNKPATGFTINGFVTGFPDSTFIYLDDEAKAGKAIDSALILKNEFHFTGKLKGSTLKAILRTKDFIDYKFLWLENETISFKAEKGKFADALISGSKNQVLEDKLDSSLKSTKNQSVQNIMFIRTYPASVISAYNLNVYSSTWGRDTTAILYNLLSKENQSTTYGMEIATFLKLNKNLKVGDHYADFSERDINGKIIKLSAIKRKVILLEFWGSWCGPCRKGNPELLKVYNQFKSKGFEILGVAADSDKKEWTDAVTQDGLTWPNVSDLKGDKNTASLIYGVYYYPTSFLIDQKGFIVARDLRGDKLSEKLMQLLK